MFDFLSSRGPGKRLVGNVQFTSEVRAVLGRAGEEATRLRSPGVGTEHVILAVLASPESEACRIFSSVGVRGTELKAHLEGLLSREARPGSIRKRLRIGGEWSGKAKQAIVRSIELGNALDQPVVSSGQLLLAVLLDPDSAASRALADRGVTAGVVRALLRKGVAPTAVLNIQLDDRSERLIYEQIVAQVQESIATGRLLPGQRLPPIRQLADELEIAPGTVARAYTELESAGTIVTDRARGTFVATPKQAASTSRPVAVRDLLRPAVVAAFHLGASADEVRTALSQAMTDIYPERG